MKEPITRRGSVPAAALDGLQDLGERLLRQDRSAVVATAGVSDQRTRRARSRTGYGRRREVHRSSFVRGIDRLSPDDGPARWPPWRLTMSQAESARYTFYLRGHPKPKACLPTRIHCVSSIPRAY